jgi:hypothetical protein
MPDLHSPLDWLRWIGRNTKRIVVLLLGVAVLCAGLAMLALPGPGVLVLILGLVILATEFAWAERVLDRTTGVATGAATKITDDRRGRYLLAASGIGMIIGGIAVAILSDPFRLVGVSVAIAGLVGLAVLLPPVQAWVREKANARPATEP